MLRLTGTPFLRPARDLSALVAEALGLITKVTEPALVTVVTPLPNVIAARRQDVGIADAGRHVEVKPRPNVTSRQAGVVDQNAVRRAGQGVARGAGAETRIADSGGIGAHGIISEGIIAVPGSTSSPFRVGQNGQFRTGAPMGSW